MDQTNPIRSRPPGFRRRTDTEKAIATENEFELRTALEAAGLGIFDYYPLSGELHWNSIARLHFGLSADAPVNYNVFLVGLHPDDREQVVRQFQRSMERREGTFSAEFRTIGIEDGKERFVAMSGQAFFNQWGEAARMVATTRDITDARSFREAFTEREQRIQASFYNAALGIMEVDHLDRVVTANERMCQILEYRLDELLGKSVHELTAPEDRGQSEGLNKALHEGRLPVLNYEKRYLKKNGRRVWVHVAVSPIRTAQGGHRRSIGTVEDISERKRLEEALRQSEERYRLLFDKSPLPKWVFDLETFRFLEANDAALEHYGYGREEFMGLTLRDIRLPEEFETLAAWVRTCCTRGEKFEGHARTRHRKKNKEIIDVDVYYSEILYNGKRAGLGMAIDISEQLGAEQALRSEQEARERQLVQLNAVLHQMTEGLVIFDPDGNLLDMNRAALEIHGFDNIETLRRHLHELPEIFELSDLQGRSLPLEEWPIGRVLKGETIDSYEVRVQRLDTGRTWIASYGGAPVSDGKGRTILSVVTVRDITERKRAEGERLRSQNLLSEAEKLSHTGAWEWDVLADQWTFSDEWMKIHGAGKKALSPDDLIAIAHPEDRAAIQKAFEDVRNGIKPYEMEHRIIRQDTGEIRMVRARGQFIKDPAGNIVRVYGFVQDITEQKRAEEALRVSEERYRSLFENLLDAFCYCQMIFDERGRPVDFFFLEANDAFEEMSGYANVLGKRVRDVIPGVLEAQPEMFEAFGRVAITGKPEKFDMFFTPNGRWFEVSAYSTKKGYVAVLFDNITQRKQEEQERERLIRELQRSNSELQQFAYVASHDLQEPLRTVGSYVELLAQKYKGKIDETADKYIAYAVEGADRMSLLINDLLAFSRLGTQGKHFERVDMRTVVERAMASLVRSIKESGAVMTRDEMPAVLGDQTQLVLLMENLIANAIRFRKPDVAPKIHISAERGERAWLFGVHDNGIGIEPRFYDRIFVIFQRLHTREEYAGTGVGLAISKRVVERHGGRIWVESRPGEGSSFYFSIPDREVRPGERERRSGSGENQEPA